FSRIGTYTAAIFATTSSTTAATTRPRYVQTFAASVHPTRSSEPSFTTEARIRRRARPLRGRHRAARAELAAFPENPQRGNRPARQSGSARIVPTRPPKGRRRRLCAEGLLGTARAMEGAHGAYEDVLAAFPRR